MLCFDFLIGTGSEYIAYKLYEVYFSINGESILKVEKGSSIESKQFVSYRVAHKTQNILMDNKASSIVLSNLNAPTETTNQLLELIVGLEFAEEGLKKLRLNKWHGMKERLSDKSIQHLVSLCRNIQNL